MQDYKYLNNINFPSDIKKLNNEELKELMDALNESNHPDAMKRQFRNELHRKLRLTKFLMDEGYPHKKVLREVFDIVA